MRPFSLVRPVCAMFVFALFGCAPDYEPYVHDQNLRCTDLASTPKPASIAKIVLEANPGKDADLDMLDPGQQVTLRIPGADPGANLRLVGPYRSADDQGSAVSLGPSGGNGWSFDAPAAPGSYLVRLGTADQDRIAGTIEVSPVSAQLCSTTELEPHGKISFTWLGTGQTGDRIVLYDPIEDKALVEYPADGAAYARMEGNFKAPSQNGILEMRLETGGTKTASLPILIWRPSRASHLRAPPTVRAGAVFPVQLIGKGIEGHLFQLVDPPSAVVAEAAPIASGFGPESAELRAPSRPGRYRLEYAAPDGTRDLGISRPFLTVE